MTFAQNFHLLNYHRFLINLNTAFEIYPFHCAIFADYQYLIKSI